MFFVILNAVKNLIVKILKSFAVFRITTMETIWKTLVLVSYN
jgi:hypothetical protein